MAINGASGGVGHFALQIAKARGARVTAVCRGTKTELAKQLGGEVVIDHTQQDFTKAGKKDDVIFDAFAHQGFAHFKPALAPRGFYAADLAQPIVHFALHDPDDHQRARVVSAGLRACGLSGLGRAGFKRRGPAGGGEKIYSKPKGDRHSSWQKPVQRVAKSSLTSPKVSMKASLSCENWNTAANTGCYRSTGRHAQCFLVG